jgi:hypothetical protein
MEIAIHQPSKKTYRDQRKMIILAILFYTLFRSCKIGPNYTVYATVLWK